MKSKEYIAMLMLCTCMFVASPSTVFSDTLYGFDGWSFVSMNPNTGIVTNISSPPQNGSMTNTHALDPTNNTFYYYTVSGGNKTLNTINTLTGDHSVFTSGSGLVSAMKYDPLEDTLYGFDGWSFISMNPNNGIITNIVMAPQNGSMTGSYALDPVNDSFFYWTQSGTTKYFNTINTLTGNHSAVNVSGYGLVSAMEYDPIENTLYGFDGYSFLSMAPDSHTITYISTAPPSSSRSGTYALDPVNDQFFYWTSNNGTDKIFNTINTLTGNHSAVNVSGYGLVSAMEYDYVVPEPTTLLLLISSLPLIRRKRKYRNYSKVWRMKR